MESMETLTSVLAHLKELGWDHEFSVTGRNKIELNKFYYDIDDIELFKHTDLKGIQIHLNKQ